MKTMIKWMGILALVVFAAVSCEVGGLEPEQPKGPVSNIHVKMGASILSTKSVVVTSGSDRTLNFYEGDRLYVRGLITGTSPQKIVAGYLSIDGEYGTSVTFKGDLDIFVEDGGAYVPGTHDFGDEPLEQCSDILGILVHAGAEGFTVDASSKVGSYTTAVAFSVNDLMTQCLPVYGYYDNGSIPLSVGDADDCCHPIFNCTLSGLTPEATYTLVYRNGNDIASIDFTQTLGTITADNTGYVAFACYVSGTTTANEYHGFLLTNTTDDTDIKIASLGTKALRSKVYNVTRAAGSLITLTAETGAVTLNNNDVLTGTGGADTHVTIADGATVTLKDVTINSIPDNNDHRWAGITCAGDAHINIAGTNTVKGGRCLYAGIYVPGDKDNPSNNKTLTIDGAGTLNASSYDGAGIGGGFSIASDRIAGNIVINGGTINANSCNGAGIGAGAESICGNITINGGTVTAQNTAALGGSAGIGSGRSNTWSSRCGNISITGGTVEATTVGQSAAIGTGFGNIDNSCGNISITGGTVVAMAFFYEASAIGTGVLAEGGTQTCGTITIGTGITSVIAVTDYTPVGPSEGSICGTVTIDGHVMTSAEMTKPTDSNVNLTNLQWAYSTVRDPDDYQDVPKWTLTRKP